MRWRLLRVYMGPAHLLVYIHMQKSASFVYKAEAATTQQLATLDRCIQEIPNEER